MRVWLQERADYKVIVVPGEFFDINPGKRRPGRHCGFAAMRGSRLEPVWSNSGRTSRIGEMIENTEANRSVPENFIAQLLFDPPKRPS